MTFEDRTIRFGDKYFTGEDCLRFATPWLTPGAVCWLNSVLKRNMSVLEFGAGGSTLFFADRCKTVVSVESDPMWYESVQGCLSQAQAERVRLHLLERSGSWYRNDPEEVLRDSGHQSFDVILVDPAGINRNKVLKCNCSRLKPGGLLILDNYAVLFPKSKNGMTHWGADDAFFDAGFKAHRAQGWRVHYFDDPFWSGRGTAVLVSPT